MIQDSLVVQPVIEAERFDLRPLRKSDAAPLSLYAGDERVARMTTAIPHPLPPGAMEAFVTRSQAKDRSTDVWAIDPSRHGERAELIGTVTLKRLDREQSEIAFWVAPAYWNTGIGSDAVKAMIAANPHGSKVIYAEMFQDNPASARVLTNAGFDYLGDAEAHSVARGANVPTWTYIRKL